MSKYELTFLLPKEDKTQANKLEKLIEATKAKIVKKEDWGVKKLAYSIKKFAEAKYLFFTIETEPAQIKQLEGKIKLEEKILRHLIIRVNK